MEAQLAYLKRFPLDSIKIDRSFIHGVPGDADARASCVTERRDRTA
jgi:EAL domain-containing protein (putative c-di-GMP-specific phosphodiesterase class I)